MNEEVQVVWQDPKTYIWNYQTRRSTGGRPTKRKPISVPQKTLYEQGYDDGKNSLTIKNEYKTDQDYIRGWKDGRGDAESNAI